jgi:predicted phosphodiesterase
MALESRLVDLDEGKVMVVGDIRGSWENYRQVINIFESQHYDRLVFLGDLVDAPFGEEKSKDIIDDLIKRKANDSPDSKIIALLGKQETGYIYHLGLGKGLLINLDVTGRKIGDDHLNFLHSMPFAARTAGGVLLTYSGASEIIGRNQEKRYGVDFAHFSNWSHFELINDLVSALDGLGLMSKKNIYNSHIGEVFKRKNEGRFLLEYMEHQKDNVTNLYVKALNYLDTHGPTKGHFGLESNFLKYMGTDHNKLNVIVSGHIDGPDYAREKKNIQLRLISGTLTNPKGGTYLVLDASTPYEHASDLLPGCKSLYPSGN